MPGTGQEEAAAPHEEAPPVISFRVTTYYKRPRGQAGLTQLGSQRIPLAYALGWVIDELPAEAVDVTQDRADGADVVTIRIDWAKVPDETQGVARPAARRAGKTRKAITG